MHRNMLRAADIRGQVRRGRAGRWAGWEGGLAVLGSWQQRPVGGVVAGTGGAGRRLTPVRPSGVLWLSPAAVGGAPAAAGHPSGVGPRGVKQLVRPGGCADHRCLGGEGRGVAWDLRLSLIDGGKGSRAGVGHTAAGRALSQSTWPSMQPSALPRCSALTTRLPLPPPPPPPSQCARHSPRASSSRRRASPRSCRSSCRVRSWPRAVPRRATSAPSASQPCIMPTSAALLLSHPHPDCTRRHCPPADTCLPAFSTLPPPPPPPFLQTARTRGPRCTDWCARPAAPGRRCASASTTPACSSAAAPSGCASTLPNRTTRAGERRAGHLALKAAAASSRVCCRLHMPCSCPRLLAPVPCSRPWPVPPGMICGMCWRSSRAG